MMNTLVVPKSAPNFGVTADIVSNEVVVSAGPPPVLGGTDWVCQLQGLPSWDQNTDWTADSRPDENHLNNCLMECTSEVIKYCTGVELPADYIKDVCYGEAYTGYTYFSAVKSFLSKYCSIRSSIISCASSGSLAYWTWRFLVQGEPIIGAFHFASPTSNDGHAMNPFYIDPNKVRVNDPWSGAIREFSYDEYWQWSLGWVMGIHHGHYV